MLGLGPYIEDHTMGHKCVALIVGLWYGTMVWPSEQSPGTSAWAVAHN